MEHVLEPAERQQRDAPDRPAVHHGHPHRLLTAALVAATAAAALAGCSSSGTPAPSSPAPSTGSTTASAAPTASDTPSVTASASTPGSAVPTTSGSATAGPAACTTVRTTAERTPGATGRSFALLTFSNTGSTPCSLTGRPTVVLLGADRQTVTDPATDGGGSADAVVLAPGAAASTLLVDDASTCSADTRSSYVRITPPGGGASVDLDLTLPPCSLSVKAVVAGTDPTP